MKAQDLTKNIKSENQESNLDINQESYKASAKVSNIKPKKVDKTRLAINAIMEKRKNNPLTKPKPDGYIFGRPKGSFKFTEEELIALAEEIVVWFQSDEDNLFFEDFFAEKGMYRTFISEHIQKSKTFSYLISQAMEIQERKLLKSGLLRKLDSYLTTFVLKNKHFYKDKIETSITHLNAPVQIIMNVEERKIPLIDDVKFQDLTINPLLNSNVPGATEDPDDLELPFDVPGELKE